MTVADLIRELQAMPNQNAPVRVRVVVDHIDSSAVWEIVDVDLARNEGPYVGLELH